MEVPNMPPSSGVPPKHLQQQLQPRHRDGREGRRGTGAGVAELRPPRLPLGQLFSRPPSPSLSSPAHPARSRENTRHGRGGQDKEAADQGLPGQCGAGPSQTPADHAGDRPRKSPPSELGPPRPAGPQAGPRRAGVTGTRGSAGGRDGAASRPGERGGAGLTRILVSRPEVVGGGDHDEPHEGGEEVEEGVPAVIVLELLARHGCSAAAAAALPSPPPPPPPRPHAALRLPAPRPRVA